MGSFVSFMSLYPRLDLGVFTSTNGPGNLGRDQFDALNNFIFQLMKGAYYFIVITNNFL